MKGHLLSNMGRHNRRHLHTLGLENVSVWHSLAISAIIVLGILLYSHTLHAPFYLDDISNIRENLPRLRGFSLPELKETAFGGLLGRRPLSNLTFAVNAYIHGMDVWGFHAVNIGIHVLNGILLYGVIFRTLTLTEDDRKRHHLAMMALAASLIWVVHPMQIQGVTYIVQRMTGMATLFTLATFLAYISGRQSRSGGGKIFFFLLAGLCWICAVASKEIAITVPLLVFVFEWFFFQDLGKAWFVRWAIPGIAMVGLLLWGAYSLYGYTPTTFLTVIDQPRGFTAFERLLTESRVLFIYLGLLIFPHPSRLNLNHDIVISQSLTDPVSTLTACIGLAAIAIFTILGAKRYRLASFCIIWFFISSSLEALAASIEIIFEHRAYLPSTLFFLPFILAADRLCRKPMILAPAFLVCLVALSFWTYDRNALWNDPVAFWEDAAIKAPDHFRPHFHLGTAYLHTGRYDRAVHALNRSLALNPPYPTEIYTNLGISYFKKGDMDSARKTLMEALHSNPNNYIALDMLGTLHMHTKHYQRAIEDYGKAIALKPDFLQARQNLGMLYMQMGSMEKATTVFQELIDKHPNAGAGYSGLGLVYGRQGQVQRAITSFEKAVQRNPGDHDTVFNLAIAYSMAGHYVKAAKAYETALEIKPTDVEAMHNLGVLYLRHLHNAERGMGFFKKALATDPNYNQAPLARKIIGPEV